MGSGSYNVKSTKCIKPIVNKMNRTINRAAMRVSASNTASFANNTGVIKKNQQFAKSLPATTLESTESLSPTCKKVTLNKNSQQKFAEINQRLDELSTELLNLHQPSPGTSSESRKSSSLSDKTKTGSGYKNSSASSTSINLDAAQKYKMETFTLKRQTWIALSEIQKKNEILIFLN